MRLLTHDLLSVSRSGYYEWRGRPTPPRTKADESLLRAIRRIYHDHKGRTGSPRITWALRHEGWRVGKNRVARLMRQNALRAKAARKFKATTNSDHNLPVAPNLLNQDFSAQRPNQKWVADITYLATGEGWLYSCRGARPLHPQSRGLGDVRTDDGETHLRCFTHGAVAVQAASRRHSPFRPRFPILRA